MILHITNDYSGSTVYKNLVRELDNIGLEQIVYNPIKESTRIGKNIVHLTQAKSKIIYSLILNKHTDRLFYKSKIKKIIADIESKVDLSKITYIHAHTWYSDGGVAYELSKKYDIPYIVAVRNTDLNIFFNYFIHLRSFGQKILLNANKIITISPIYRDRIELDVRLRGIIKLISHKLITIPNGVDQFWIDNRELKRKNVKNIDNIKFLYIGKFDKGKNVLNLVNAIQRLELKYTLTLVGGGGADQKYIEDKIKDDKNINFIGKVYDKQQLLKLYRNHDFFVMPSKAETFGLVYIEALLQGLPILYTNNEGIDGFYADNIGEKVYSADSNEIAKVILKLVQSDSISFETSVFAKNHDWRNIAKVYSELYKN